MKFVFLYTEIATYFLACCNELAKYGEVHIVRWPTNKEAPFNFEFSKNINIYNKADYSFDELQHLILNIKPSLIVCSGWIDKDYLKISKPYFNQIPTIMTCDTHWKGTLKQHLATVVSRVTLLKTFSHAWVPGQIQKKYVSKLGFKTANILTNFYSCDINYFNQIYENQKLIKQQVFPKRLLYVGRYYDFKGIKELWQAFVELQVENPNNWELWCLGVGDIEPIKHPKIKHFGFVQPKDLENYSNKTGVFILPSKFEPWGVVVHEYAAAGFPLLLSTEVGASECFLKENNNGFLFNPNSISEIKLAMQKIFAKTDVELVAMGVQSHNIAQCITPQTWAENICKLLQ